MNFERIFNQYSAVLEKHKKQLLKFSFSPEKIKEVKKTLSRAKDNSYSYSFSTINIIIPKSMLPKHPIPNKLGNVEVVLSIEDEIIIKSKTANLVEDPFCKLGKFNLVLYCQQKHYTSSWHLDRHVIGEGHNSPQSLHPLYHLTFGGYHMENLINEDSDEFGRTLILRAPRIMHPPMELILGIDFIFNHYIPKKELDLLSDPGYLNLIHELKKHFWLPFSLAIAKNYCDRISIDNDNYNFDTTFVSSVLSF